MYQSVSLAHSRYKVYVTEKEILQIEQVHLIPIGVQEGETFLYSPGQPQRSHLMSQ